MNKQLKVSLYLGLLTLTMAQFAWWEFALLTVLHGAL